MARSVRVEPKVHVDHDLVAHVAVYFGARDEHWAGLMEGQGAPPGGTAPIDVNSGTVSMAVPVARVREALDWLLQAVKKATAQGEQDESERVEAEENAEAVLMHWWGDSDTEW